MGIVDRGHQEDQNKRLKMVLLLTIVFYISSTELTRIERYGRKKKKE